MLKIEEKLPLLYPNINIVDGGGGVGGMGEGLQHTILQQDRFVLSVL